MAHGTNPADRQHKPPILMSDKNKTTHPEGGATTTDSAKRPMDRRDQSTPQSPGKNAPRTDTDAQDRKNPGTPDLEQGREHVPNVDAQQEAADTRRTAEQAHVQNSTTDIGARSNDRKDSEAGDAKRTVAEGQGDRNSGNEPVKPSASTSENR